MKTVVITGANRGIGLELCREYHKRSWQVIAICRQASTDLKDLGVTILSSIDVSNDAITAGLGDQLKGHPIDVLINNAGILKSDNFEQLDFEAIKQQFEVNALGPLRVTKALLPHCNEKAKIVMISSRMGSIADNTSGGYYGYRMSKAALNMAAVSLGHDLRKKGITIGLLHPGFVRTDMTKNQGNISPQDAAKFIIKRIDELKQEDHVTFTHADGQVLPW